MSDRYDPAWVAKTKNDYWPFLSAQLGHWNKMRIMAVDCAMYEKLPQPVLDALASEAATSQQKEYIWAQDGSNGAVYLLGPQKIMERDMIMLNGISVWDPLHNHVPMVVKRARDVSTKVPRPPNAFILYRKDKHAQLKASFPDIHNNEISVLVGSMWKNETPDVRATYFKKSEDLKNEIMNLNPDYKYRPRKPEQIPRRRGLRISGTTMHPAPTNGSPPAMRVLRQRDNDTIQALLPGASLAESYFGTVKIHQESLARPNKPFVVNDWVPNGVPVSLSQYAEQLLQGQPYIDPQVTFGRAVPEINLNGAMLPAPVSDDISDAFMGQMVNDS